MVLSSVCVETVKKLIVLLCFFVPNSLAVYGEVVNKVQNNVTISILNLLESCVRKVKKIAKTLVTNTKTISVKEANLTMGSAVAVGSAVDYTSDRIFLLKVVTVVVTVPIVIEDSVAR